MGVRVETFDCAVSPCARYDSTLALNGILWENRRDLTTHIFLETIESRNMQLPPERVSFLLCYFEWIPPLK